MPTPWPAGIVPRLQTTPVQLPWPGVAEITVTWAGIVSVTMTFSASTLLTLVTVTW